MNLLTAYYHITCDILKNYISIKPELKLSNAKNYMGQIVKKDGKVTIYISKWHHISNPYLMDVEDRNEIIDTICHELAHMNFVDHGTNHQELTEAYKSLVINQLKLRILEEELKAV